jgi:TatD DNase family protein
MVSLQIREFCVLNTSVLMSLIDTHSHIYLPEFTEDLAAMFKRADNQCIKKILMPAIDSSTHESMLALEKAGPQNYLSMMGLHPCSVKSDTYRKELDIVKSYLDQRTFIAIGEIGLDFYWDKTFVADQQEAFEQQIKWALEFDLPIVIHSRDSIDACIEVVKKFQHGKLRGVFHCFSGNAEQAKKIMDLDFYLGIGGVVTFKNSGLDKVMEQIDLSKVVLETDAPYLAPVPFRGKRNEPAYLRYVVEKLSAIRNIPIQEVGEITTANAGRLFRL